MLCRAYRFFFVVMSHVVDLRHVKKKSLNGLEVVISAKLPEHSRPHNSTFRC